MLTALKPSMALRSTTVAELMTPNPLSFVRQTPIRKAAALLAYHALDAAPVVDSEGRLEGVVSRRACDDWHEFALRSSPHGFVPEDSDAAPVAEIMSPAIGIVRESDSSESAIQTLLHERLRRLYVVDDESRLVGVASTSDVLRRLLTGGHRRRTARSGAAVLC